MEQTSWEAYSKLVLKKLEDHDNADGLLLSKIETLKDDTNNGFSQISKENLIFQAEMKSDIRELKVKSGVWGAIGAMIPIAVGLIIWIIKEIITSGLIVFALTGYLKHLF